MRRRGSLLEWLWSSVQKGERRIIRVMVLASVILVLMQLSSMRDPLEFYMAMAEKVEAPPLDLPPLSNSTLAEQVNVWNMTLKAVPAAPVRVIQNGKVIATLAKGEQQLTVRSGQIQLDGVGISQRVQVQVLKKDSQLLEPRLNQLFVLQGTKENVTIRP